MYAEAIAMAGLAAVAAAVPGAPPAYGSWGSSSAVVSLSSTAYYPSSSAPVSVPAYSGSASYSSSPVSSAPVPSGSAYPACWSECFAAAGISSEGALCGNTEVDACIQSKCSGAEDQAYWAWYESYCPATSSPVGPTPTGPSGYSTPATVSSPIPTASYPACWSACFAQEGVSSEASLCGNSAVSQCIYETCDSSADQAYWSWYEGYCTGSATVTTVITLTSPCAESGTTSWASTAWTPAGSPSSPAAPYPTASGSAAGGAGGAGGWGASTTASAIAASGTGAGWGAQSSGWPVPATGGASVVAKSGFALLAGFLGLVYLL